MQNIESTNLLGAALEEPLVQTLTYSLEDEGRVLVVETRIEGGSLPHAVELVSSFDRCD